MNILSCSECIKKDDLIAKYLKLIKLLKTKCQKNAQSFAKSNTLPSVTLSQSSNQNSKIQPQNCHQKSVSIKPELNAEKNSIQWTKTCHFQLALTIIANKCKKALLKQSFHAFKQSINDQLANKQSANPNNLNLQFNLSSIVKQTLIYGRSLQSKSNFPLQTQKQLHSRIFILQLQNQSYRKKIQLLQKQIDQSEKRFLKQTQKKWQSLETVAEEIRQKTQLVAELQQTIKRYEKALRNNSKVISPESVLIQDSDELKRSCMRLQTINEKLNEDINALQTTIQSLNNQIIQLNLKNESKIKEFEDLKIKNFEYASQLNDYKKMENIYKKSMKKLNKKIDLINAERKLYISLQKNSEPTNEEKNIQTKNTESSVEEIISNKNQFVKQLKAEQKIEEIFAFLFHIKVENYQIQNIHLFDQDQIELLNQHKQIFLNSVMQNSFIETKRSLLKKQQHLNPKNLFQTDEVFYINRRQSNLQNSFLGALDPTKSHVPQLSNLNVHQGNMKLIQIEIEKSKLIQKISELKNLQMHIRNVVLNLLKVLDLSNVKGEAEGILSIVLELFEYSQDQKATIFKEKKKKFWGIL